MDIEESQQKFRELFRGLMGDRKQALSLITLLKPENLELQDKNGHTLLHLLIINERTDIAIALVKRSTSKQLKIKDKCDFDPINLAVNAKNKELLEAMADIAGPAEMKKYEKRMAANMPGLTSDKLFENSAQWVHPFQRFTQEENVGRKT